MRFLKAIRRIFTKKRRSRVDQAQEEYIPPSECIDGEDPEDPSAESPSLPTSCDDDDKSNDGIKQTSLEVDLESSQQIVNVPPGAPEAKKRKWRFFSRFPNIFGKKTKEPDFAIIQPNESNVNQMETKGEGNKQTKKTFSALYKGEPKETGVEIEKEESIINPTVPKESLSKTSQQTDFKPVFFMKTRLGPYDYEPYRELYTVKDKRQIKKLAVKIQRKSWRNNTLAQPEIDILKALSGHRIFPEVYGELNTPECLVRSLYVEYIDGLPLFEALKLKNEIPSDQVIELLMWQIGQAVRYMHSLNILHRNINRSNIIVNSRGQLRLVGFKFATVAPTFSNVPCWHCHRAPEMNKPAVPYGYPVDYFAIGATFFSLIYRIPVPKQLLNVDVSRPLKRNIKKYRRRGLVPVPYAVNAALMDLLDQLLYPFPDGRLGENIIMHPFFENAKILNKMIYTGLSKREFKARGKRYETDWKQSENH